MNNGKHTIPQLSTDVSVLAARLATVPEGSSVTYEEISEWTGRDIAGKSRHVLTSALKILERERGICFETVWGEGVRRVDIASGALNCARSSTRRIRRSARRTERRLARLSERGIEDPAAASEVAMRRSLLAIVDLTTSPRGQDALTGAQTDSPLTAAEACRALLEHKS